MSEKLGGANTLKTQMQLRVDELENDDVSLKVCDFVVRHSPVRNFKITMVNQQGAT